MRASRVLSILLRLQAHGRATAAELAEALEVSERTIFRDIDELAAAGVPVIADRGRAGGFKLADGFRTQLTGLTAGEAETVFLAGLPGPAAELGLADLMAMARLKLMAAIPAGAEAGRIAARFHLDATGWFHAPDSVALLPLIARAVWDARYLEMSYGESQAPRRAARGSAGSRAKGRHLVSRGATRQRAAHLSGGPDHGRAHTRRTLCAAAGLRPGCVVGTLLARVRGVELSQLVHGPPVAARTRARAFARLLCRGRGGEVGRQARPARLGALHAASRVCRARRTRADATWRGRRGHLTARSASAPDTGVAQRIASLHEGPRQSRRYRRAATASGNCSTISP